ncbi:HET-domain-containing protein [Hypoxylon sp. FL1857]|nr:HET-domain-containing protein [Hypoxylon sp. FL1857]
MYLLNVETFELHEFQGNSIPKYEYVILSHIWGADEVSLQDLQAGRGPSKKGYEKITLTCEQAHRDGFKWAWVDTCCIDKTSSAELSEAINSMYQWYKDSALCYAYLSDVDEIEFPYTPSTEDEDDGQISRWFTRAWTLQELIAPSRINFYDRGWGNIGRCEGTTARIVSIVTRIPEPLILGKTPLSQYSAAQKMSWAAYRRSTRPEDVAYSLLGLFDINMPLLYGEGERKAFIRLQEEILRETDDHSLLCWTVPSASHRAWTIQSVFATSPDDFATSGNIKGHLFDSGVPSAVTNRGLQIRLNLTSRLYGERSHLYHKNVACSIYDAELNAAECEPGKDIHINQMTIILVRTPQVSRAHSQSVNRYARLATPALGRISIKKCYTDIMEAVRNRAGLIYIHKTLFDWEQDRFGQGGVHLQNIPIMDIFSPLSKPAEGGVPDHDLKIQSISYSGVEQELHDLSGGVPPNAEEGITWSPIYNCIKFEFPPRRAPGSPLFVIFDIGSASSRESFKILLAWNDEYIHFSLRPGEHQMPKFLSFEYWNTLNRVQNRLTKQDLLEQKEIKEFWAKLIKPTDPSTHRGNCWEMYGEIARTSATIGEYDTELILEREDPNTEFGEAAGNRLHLLIRASITKSREVTNSPFGLLAKRLKPKEKTGAALESHTADDKSIDQEAQKVV